MEQLPGYSCKSNGERKKHIWVLSTSFQGVKRLFVLAYFIAANHPNNETGIKNNEKYFLPRGEINNYNALNDGKIVMINQLMI